MFFALPWMLLGLLGLPALAAIYWLRSRARPRTVSSLFLWGDQRRPRHGGRIVERLQTPLIFFLELLAIAAIAAAAAVPGLATHTRTFPLVIVLDDSFSMQAGGTSTSRDRATQRVLAMFRREKYVARVILSGPRPHLLGGIVQSADDLQQTLNEWKCRAPTDGLEVAIGLAGEVGGKQSRVLVITDHAPDGELPAGKVEWWAFGESIPNFAVTAAAREFTSGGEAGDRILLEITNFSNVRKPCTFQSWMGEAEQPQQKKLELASGESSRLIFNVPSDAGVFHAKLMADELEFDNEVQLVSPNQRPLRVQISLDGEADTEVLREQLTRAIESTGQALLVNSRPELLITNTNQETTSARWQLDILSGSDPVSFQGPFIQNRNHPLTEGLSLNAVIWTAAKELIPRGLPVITTGNRVLLAEEEDVLGRHRLQMVLEPELSNLTNTPDWPILFTNLIRNCLASRPGPSAANIRLGQPVRVILPDDAAFDATVELKAPDGTTQQIPAHGQSVDLHPRQTGVYEVRSGSLQDKFACNPLHAAESDLRECTSGTWGDWNQSAEYRDQRLSLSWALILLALGCLGAEMVIISRSGGGGV